LVSQLPAPPIPKGAKFTSISLKDKANQSFMDNFHGDAAGNNLKDFPQGEQKFGDIPFTIGEKCMQLSSKIVSNFPEKIEGISVNLKCDKLHILHATGYGGGPNAEDSAGHCKDGTEIGEYIVRYEDATTEKIPIVYGKDVRDWFFVQDEKDPDRSKVVWKGENENSKQYNAKLRVYLTAWTNPKTDKKIKTIDFVSFGDKTPCAPFCLGLTAEGK
jgi:hypothetical protein